MALKINEEIVLASGETIVKEWNYAASGNKKNEESGHCKLVITNRRLIHSIGSKGRLAREEIPLKHITSIDTVLTKTRKLWLIAIAAFLLAVGAALVIFNIWQASIPFFIVGVALSVLSFITKTKFGLRINTDIGGDNRTIYLCNNIDSNDPSSFSSLSVAGANITINAEVVEDIVNTIGALLLTKQY